MRQIICGIEVLRLLPVLPVLSAELHSSCSFQWLILQNIIYVFSFDLHNRVNYTVGHFLYFIKRTSICTNGVTKYFRCFETALICSKCGRLGFPQSTFKALWMVPVC
uniref:Secreted protein n=1 Tax=Xiphophorus maculatus TaxID=8083 RepID=A0A3B5PSH3_XIPMA